MRKVTVLSVVAAFAVVSGLAFFSIAIGQDPPQPTETSKESKRLAELGGPERYLTHISTDKPIYRIGDVVFVRATVLHQETRRPISDNIFGSLEIKGPKGETVLQSPLASADSVFGFRWSVPEGQTGGQYTVKITPGTGDAPAERTFEIRAYRPPRLRSQINFLSKGYSEGEQVTAFLKTERAEGGIPAGAKVTIVARVDDTEVHRAEAEVDGRGNCMARFQLPDAIDRGEGTLAMIIEDGGVVETASKSIPILLQHVDLNLYPEGGSLVAGLSNRVYLEAFTPAKKPADIAGIIVDQRGNQVAAFVTEHEGRGRFTFTPEAGRTYFLEVRKPAGIELQYPLPKVVDDGVSIASAADVFPNDGDISVDVASSSESDYVVTLSHRGLEIDSVDVQLNATTKKRVNLDAKDYEGVLAVTVWTKLDVAQAERLVFREPKHALNVAIKPDSSEYVPGGKARLTITTTDKTGRPVSGLVGITVTDDSVLEMIETRDRAPRLPAMVYLENDVRDLADAHVYMDPHNAAAPLAMDLLLGTQGWRRFVLVNINKALNEYGDSVRRALAIRRPVRPTTARGRMPRRFANRNDNLDLFFSGQPKNASAIDEDNALGIEVDERFLREGRQAELSAIVLDGVAEGLEERAKEIGAPDDENDDGAAAHFAVPNLELAKEPAALIQEADVAFRRIRSLDQSFDKKQLTQAIFREYAHKASVDRKPNQRTDFAETLFWTAATKTNEDGNATVEFDLNDSVTSFKVLADAFTGDGTIGAGIATIESIEPFYVEPKLPLEVTSGDFLQIPLSLVNATSAGMDDGLLSITSHSWKSIQTSKESFELAAQDRTRRILGVRIGQFHGEADLTLSAQAGAYSDQVTRKLLVKPQGFPIQQAFGGILEADKSVKHSITIPHSVVSGSATSKVTVHPSPLASMTEAFAGLIREPNGCFEQTSSSNFPLVMAQQYFQSHVGVDPDLVTRSAEMLDKGYTKLVGFECKSKGFEWFGSDPGHDALTAYGLLEFNEMAKVRNVDSEMMARTKKWLLDQRDGKGGFERKTHTLHTWLANPECANSYNTWALLEAKVDVDLTTEIAWVQQAAQQTKNSYVVALAANVMATAGDSDAARSFCKRLSELLSEAGSVSGATTSVVGSGGEALSIETTALAVSAWLQFPEFTAEVEEGITYLSQSCRSGRFGSTQSTILALRAIVQYDQARSKPKAPGFLRLFVDGQQVGRKVPFDESTQESIEMPDFDGLLTPGEHSIEIEMADGSNMPYSVAISYNSITPNSSKDCRLSLEVTLNDTEIDEGNITEARVVVANQSKEKLPTPIAIIGIPGGMEVRHEQLKELKSEGRIAAYEVIGREVVLYWRVFDAGDVVDLPISLIAAIPGQYTAPASRIYQYYTDEHKQWVAGSAVTISPK